MTEQKAVTRYTLVPIGMVLAAIILTTAITNYLWADKTVVAILRVESESLRREFNIYRKATNARMDHQAITLYKVDTALRLFAQKLDVTLPDTMSTPPSVR